MAAKYILARSAGFCFGVERSIRMAEEALDSGACRCLGELIHNRDAVASLEKKVFRSSRRFRSCRRGNGSLSVPTAFPARYIPS